MKVFYTRFISIQSLHEELDSLDLSDEQRLHLANLIDSSLHHAILDEILSNLDDHNKKLFLSMLNEDPESEKLLEFLNEKIDGIEDKIKKTSDDLVTEMHKDIKGAKQVKSQE